VRLTREVVDQYQMQLGSQYPLTFTALEALTPMKVDRHRMQQTLSNVLENAIKYSPEGGRIEVGVRASDSGVLLTVSDHGIGLPPEATRTIFTPFGRGTNAQRQQVPGMGLGLYIARQIVDQHGGRIWAESAGEGSGTLVSIWLPNAADLAPGAGWPSAATQPLVPSRSRVLVVEDESAVRHTLRDALELEGYECRVASDGRDALSVLSEWPADIIVLDLIMPIMDGRAFRHEQRANPLLSNIPIVIVSAGRPSASRAAELGAAAIFGKPFELDNLLEALDEIIATRRV
jgi:CheY-like chemotaxis protein